MKKFIVFMSVMSLFLSSCQTDSSDSSSKENKAYLELQNDSLPAMTFTIEGEEISFDPFDDTSSFIKAYPATYEEAKLSEEIAKARLELYKISRSLSSPTPYNPKEDIYGFTFKLEYLEKFITEIRNRNIQHGDSIDGVRVYYSRNLPAGVLKHDVFLIPTRNFKNIYQIDSDFTKRADEIPSIKEILKIQDSNDLILNASVPCPHDCN